MESKYRTQDRETGTLIDEFDNEQDAINAVKAYEEIDTLEGTYTPNFYEVKPPNMPPFTP